MKRGPAYSYRKKYTQSTWERYDIWNGAHGLTISGASKRYQVRILDNAWFCPPETIGKRICWVSLQINELQARLYRMTYGSLP